jgi:aspartate racemase
MNHNPSRPLDQCTVGVLGGMSNQATGHYYQRLNEHLNCEYGGWDNGEIVIVSVNFGNIERFVRNGLWEEAKTYLNEKITRLERAGADVIVCVSNTMHQVVDPLMADRSTQFIHIADPTGSAINTAGLKKIALLGTLPVMNSVDLVKRYREKFGVEIIVPSEADKVIVDQIIFDQLVRGDLRAASKAEYIRIIRSAQEQGAEGVILGCTEIFLLIEQADLPGLPVFDTASLHIAAAVEFVKKHRRLVD